MILSPDKPNQETQSMEEIPISGGTEARSEKAGKCRKRRKKGLSGSGPNLVETTQNYTSTSDHVQYLCEELIIEIFTRLPAKSLLRFRSLSKSLYSCIGSPSFIRMHTSRSPKKVLIRYDVCSKGTKQIFSSLPSEDQLRLCRTRGYNGIKEVEFPYGRDCKCAGSCNGIFCTFNKGYVTFLWNPSIRRKLIVPRCPARIAGCNSGFILSTGVGFGFETITDDYKIVSLPLFEGIGKISSYVYTMKTGAWWEIASPAPSFYEATTRGCFVNGALHWVVKYVYTRSDKGARFYILAFNLSTHVFGKILLPEPTWKTEQLTTIQGSLAAISTKRDGDSWIWVMKEYNNAASWFVFFKSKTNQVIGQLNRILQPTSDGDLFFHNACEGYVVYNPKIGTRSRLKNLNTFCDEEHQIYSSIIDMETCVESLQLLEKGDGFPRLPTISSYS